GEGRRRRLEPTPSPTRARRERPSPLLAGPAARPLRRRPAAARRAAPALGLTYDVERSRAENDDVVIALSPRNEVASGEHLAALAKKIQEAAQGVAAAPGVLVRIGGQAA
ncbi:MAG TPA: hypothetical protein VLM40_12410, partial [Gemmata sp.]|nr:hypothetical protein [Gemmata sp.]